MTTHEGYYAAVRALMNDASAWPNEVLDVLREIARRHGVRVEPLPVGRGDTIGGLWHRGHRLIEVRSRSLITADDVAILAHELAHCIRDDWRFRRCSIPRQMIVDSAAAMPGPPGGPLEYQDVEPEELATDATALRLLGHILKGRMTTYVTLRSAQHQRFEG